MVDGHTQQRPRRVPVLAPPAERPTLCADLSAPPLLRHVKVREPHLKPGRQRGIGRTELTRQGHTPMVSVATDITRLSQGLLRPGRRRRGRRATDSAARAHPWRIAGLGLG